MPAGAARQDRRGVRHPRPPCWARRPCSNTRCDIDLRIDALLFHPWLAAEVPGRMAVNSAACFLIAGSALALRQPVPRVSGKFALCSEAIAC